MYHAQAFVVEVDSGSPLPSLFNYVESINTWSKYYSSFMLRVNTDENVALGWVDVQGKMGLGMNALERKLGSIYCKKSNRILYLGMCKMTCRGSS